MASGSFFFFGSAANHERPAPVLTSHAVCRVALTTGKLSVYTLVSVMAV